MINTRNFKLGMTVVSAVLSIACSSDMQGTQANQTAMANPTSKTESAWVNSPQKHNNSGISMRYLIEGELAVGKPVAISLEFSGARANDALVMITPPAGLSMGMTEGMQQSGEGYAFALKTGEITTRTVSFTPNAEGEHFIGFRLVQSGRGSASGIMLRLGGDAAIKKDQANLGKITTTEQGEKLVIMPAK